MIPALHAARVHERVLVELGIHEIHLEEREAVRQRLRRVGHRRHAVGDVVDRGERRAVLLANAREFVAEPLGAGGEREQQAPLGSEALHQGGRRDAGFLRDVGQRQVRAEARDDAVGGGEEVLVAGGARPRAHQ